MASSGKAQALVAGEHPDQQLVVGQARVDAVEGVAEGAAEAGAADTAAAAVAVAGLRPRRWPRRSRARP